MTNQMTLIALSISGITLIALFFTILLTQKNKSQLKNSFLALLACVSLWVIPLIFKILLKNTSINPYIFECISGIGNYFTPITFLILSEVFIKTKITPKRYHLFLLIIPCISSFLLITNDLHHLLFENFSPNLNEIVYGKFYYVNIVYMYSLYIISMIRLVVYSLKNSSFFSKQSLYLTIGSAVPLVVNILGTIKVITITTFTTPITFVITLLLYSRAIFKFNFLKVTPIALQRVVDRMSDSYIILNMDYSIIDFNKPLINTFHLQSANLRGTNIFDFLNNINNDKSLSNTFKKKFKKIKDSTKSISFEQEISSIQQTFTIEINNIFSESSFIGILVLFKDITQHKRDMETIQNNQNMLIEQERLASLGQMIGGIAHNLKTPIFSISGGLEGLSDLIKEYDESIEDDTVTNEDMHDIAKDMKTWIEKLKEHVSYMSDVITTVKGQAVTMSEEQNILFPVSELFQHVYILMQHELKQKLTILNISNSVPESVEIEGNINSLVQVINNLISNAIEAYEFSNHQKIVDLSGIYDKENKIITLSIKDYGPGLPKEVQEKLFKEMVTTKGKDGTGLGLFMSYSNIKAHFNGEITYETQKDIGTTFYIRIPIK